MSLLIFSFIFVLFIPFLLVYILHVSILYIKAAGWWEPTLDPDTPAHLVSRWSGETYSFFLKLWRSQPDQGQYLMLISWQNTVSSIKLWKRKVYVAQFRCFMFIGIFKTKTWVNSRLAIPQFYESHCIKWFSIQFRIRKKLLVISEGIYKSSELAWEPSLSWSFLLLKSTHSTFKPS